MASELATLRREEIGCCRSKLLIESVVNLDTNR
jgi:hypothetical protein